MVDEKLLKNVQKAVNLINELNILSVEDLKNAAMQYGLDFNGDKEEIVLSIVRKKLTVEEYEDYQKYVSYLRFKRSMSNLSLLDESVDQIQRIFEEKYKMTSESNRADDQKREVELQFSGAMSLVRLNTEYAAVKKALDDYISKETKSGMKIASLSEKLEFINSRNIFYRFLHRGKAEDLEKKKHQTVVFSLIENEAAYKKYEATVKNYVSKLRELFYKMLDNRVIANAVYLYRTMPRDVEDENFYKVGNLSDIKFTLEEKEAIFDDFVKEANFDEEEHVTGPIFYEAVQKYVTKYYSIMKSRIAIKQSKLVKDIKKIVDGQKGLVSGVYKDLCLYYGNDEETFGSLGKDSDPQVKRKK